jgi:hypothetical protein
MKFITSVLFALLIITVYADESKTEDQSKPAHTHSVQTKLKELQNNTMWQNFLRQRESADINYDLYRITGPNVNQNVITMGGGEPKGYLVNKHNEMFCSPSVDKNCKALPLYEHADIKTSILLGQNIYNTPEQVVLANEVIKNITNPFPSIIALEMLSASQEERKLPKNQAALADALIQEARSGIAKNSFNNMVLNRLSLDALNSSVSMNQNFSILSLMEQQAKNRFEDQAWFESIEKSNRDNLLKEMVKMEAFKIWMEYHKYKQNERIEALLATMVAEQSSINQLLREQKNSNAFNR